MPPLPKVKHAPNRLPTHQSPQKRENEQNRKTGLYSEGGFVKELMSTREVARLYQVTSAAVLNWIHTGKLKAYTTPGGHYRVARDDLDTFAREYSPPPAVVPDLRLLLVGSDHEFYAYLRDAVRFRWPAAQIEHACSEFEIGWWLARLQPSYLVVRPGFTPAGLLSHCRRLVADARRGPCLVELTDGAEHGLGEWVDRLGTESRPSLRVGRALS